MDSATQELLDQLARTPDKIAQTITGLSDSKLRHKSSDDFSVLESICHLRDLEIEGFAVRIKRILAEDEPVLEDFDGGKIAAERDYNSQESNSAIQAFLTARTNNIELMRSVEPASFDRTATLEGVGRITLRDLLSLMREHDEGHLQTLI